VKGEDKTASVAGGEIQGLLNFDQIFNRSNSWDIDGHSLSYLLQVKRFQNAAENHYIPLGLTLNFVELLIPELIKRNLKKLFQARLGGIGSIYGLVHIGQLDSELRGGEPEEINWY